MLRASDNRASATLITTTLLLPCLSLPATAWGQKLVDLKIFSTPDHFDEQRVKPTEDGYQGSFSALFAKVNAYEAQGYELFENNALAYGASGAPVKYVLLRRPKQ